MNSLAEKHYSEKPTGTLYHYTSLAGLIGIIESRALWVSDTRYLNDSAEMKYLVDLLGSEAQKRTGQNRNDNLLTQFKDWISHRIVDGHMLFVASLTTNGNLLSQWNRYCPNGKGISIGFTDDLILRCSKGLSYRVGKCIYDIKHQLKLCEAILDKIEELALKRGENKDPSQRHPSNSFHGIFEEVEDDLLNIAALVKHPSFKEEEEWRVVSPVVKNYVETAIAYREGISMLIPYMKLSLTFNANGPIEIQKIFLGPTPNHNLSMNSLSNYLSKNGVFPKEGMFASQIPVRYW